METVDGAHVEGEQERGEAGALRHLSSQADPAAIGCKMHLPSLSEAGRCRPIRGLGGIRSGAQLTAHRDTSVM